jgi:hypothetical protein
VGSKPGREAGQDKQDGQNDSQGRADAAAVSVVAHQATNVPAGSRTPARKGSSATAAQPRPVNLMPKPE